MQPAAARRLAPDDGLPYFVRLMPGFTRSRAGCPARTSPGRSRPSDRTSQIPRGRRGDGSRSGSFAELAIAKPTSSCEAGWAHVRAGRGRSHLRRHRPPGDPRRGKVATGQSVLVIGAAGASARHHPGREGVRGRGHGVCSTSKAELVDRSGRTVIEYTREDSRTGRGGGTRSSTRWPPPPLPPQTSPRPEGHPRDRRREGGNDGPGVRPPRSSGRPPLALLGSAPSPRGREGDQRTSSPAGADRSRQGHAGGRQDVSARRCPKRSASSTGPPRGKIVISVVAS